MKTYGLYINGQYVQSTSAFALHRAFGESSADKMAWINLEKGSDRADEELLEAALQGAHETHSQILNGFFSLSERLSFLSRLRSKIGDQKDNLAKLIASEVGKPIRLARAEVDRALVTLAATLEEAPDFLSAKNIPTHLNAGASHLWATYSRVPRGPLLAITPFNFPLNLVIHKLAPAIAAGCPVLLKPSPKSALTALALIDLCHACELPAGMMSLINCDNSTTLRLCKDRRVEQVSFTGSAAVGWALMEGLRKPVSLELGGNAPVYVDSSTELKSCAKKLVEGAFNYSGQSCISVQNIFAHKDCLEPLTQELIRATEEYCWGNPLSEQTLCGPVIDLATATRLEAFKTKLKNEGAKICAEAGSPLELDKIYQGADSSFVRPTIFSNVPLISEFHSSEVFGPYADLREVSGFEEFIKVANKHTHRLQAALFTKNLGQISLAAQRLHYGGIIINESSAFRLDPMPYGGVGLAGLGREGPRFAMEHFTETRALIANLTGNP